MSDKTKMVTNSIGRRVPTVVNGLEQLPFPGVGKHEPSGGKRGPSIRSSKDYPADGDKRVANLQEAFERCGLRDGMVVSAVGQRQRPVRQHRTRRARQHLQYVGVAGAVDSRPGDEDRTVR